MKTYTVVVTAKGGAWKGMRRKYQVTVDASNRNMACELGLDKVEANLKASRENDYDSLTVSSCRLDR